MCIRDRTVSSDIGSTSTYASYTISGFTIAAAYVGITSGGSIWDFIQDAIKGGIHGGVDVYKRQEMSKTP